MRVTTKKQEARAKFAQVAAERAAQQRKNVEDLAQVVAEVAKIDDVEAWLEARIDKARQEAGERRRRHEVAAGKLLAVVCSRGESVQSVAELLGITQTKVREYLKAAETAPADNGVAAKVVTNGQIEHRDG